MVCLRIEINGQPVLYAAFIDSEPPKVVLLGGLFALDALRSGSIPASGRPSAICPKTLTRLQEEVAH
jgi:hypothetical protein